MSKLFGFRSYLAKRNRIGESCGGRKTNEMRKRDCSFASSEASVQAAEGGGEGRHTHSMEDKVAVTELQTAERHGHPALDVCGEKDERAVLDDHLEIGVEELEDKIQIRLGREHIQELERERVSDTECREVAESLRARRHALR